MSDLALRVPQFSPTPRLVHLTHKEDGYEKCFPLEPRSQCGKDRYVYFIGWHAPQGMYRCLYTIDLNTVPL